MSVFDIACIVPGKKETFMALEDVLAIKKCYDSILYYYTLCYFSAIKLGWIDESSNIYSES